MAKTPEDTALSAVAKAILDHDKASDKLAAIKEKYDAAVAAEKRAARTVTWAATHPDLPDDFDLDTFRAETLEPFDEEPVSDELEAEGEEIGAAIESGEIDPDQLEVPDDASSLDDELDVDDPFGDDEPAPKARSRR